ncbi:MAG: AAA family ATPase [Neptuniibacter sp.]
MAITVNSVNAIEQIPVALQAKLVPMIHGSPGIGKSDIIKQIASEYNLQIIDKRLSQCDPTDLMGFPTVCKETGKAFYAPMNTFPLETDELPSGKDGWLLFLDEINSAPKAVQAAAYKLTLDRQVGEHTLHEKVLVACAGNKDTDNAIVHEMSTALQSRLVHFELDIDPKAWLAWASDNGIDYRITSYINFKPDSLYTFKPDHSDKTFACPRTWEFASKLINGHTDIKDRLALLAGTISEGVAREFIQYVDIFTQIPTISQIVNNPEKLPVPEEPGTLYAICGSIGNHAKKDNIDPLMKFINRMPVEFQVITLKDTMKRNPTLVQEQAVMDWVAKSASELL